MTKVKMTKFVAAVALSGAFGVMGLGAGVASADPPWLQGPHGHGHDDWHDDHGKRWDGPGPRHWEPARYWDPVRGCITAGGPLGYVEASVCI